MCFWWHKLLFSVYRSNSLHYTTAAEAQGKFTLMKESNFQTYAYIKKAFSFQGKHGDLLWGRFIWEKPIRIMEKDFPGIIEGHLLEGSCFYYISVFLLFQWLSFCILFSLLCFLLYPYPFPLLLPCSAPLPILPLPLYLLLSTLSLNIPLGFNSSDHLSTW